MKDRSTLDVRACIARNKEVAMRLYGDRLDENRNIIDTNYYFDGCWRLCSREPNKENA